MARPPPPNRPKAPAQEHKVPFGVPLCVVSLRAMALRQRVAQRADEPMTWTRAILLGFFIWTIAILILGQVPSLIIYKADEYVAQIIEFSKRLPLVSDRGLATLQIRIIRDIIANTVQIGLLVAMLVGAYVWQERKRKRTGSKGLSDPVKGYMSGK